MIERYWKLAFDPFAARNRPIRVDLPTQLAAEERLVRALEVGERTVRLLGCSGLGKSTVLARVLARIRRPNRRIAWIVGPTDATALHLGLAERLGARNLGRPDRSQARRILAETLALCRNQGAGVVLAVDDAHVFEDQGDRLDLQRLSRLDSHPKAKVATILAETTFQAEGFRPNEFEADCDAVVRLVPLTRTEATDYLFAKLQSAGRGEAIFTPKAITLIHGNAQGVPGAIDRIASAALRAAAGRRFEMVNAEIVESVGSSLVDGSREIGRAAL